MSISATNCTIGTRAIYLNDRSSYYTINISPHILGNEYIPDPNDPYNEPGSWSIRNIFAGKKPASGVVPTTTFSLSQQLITFYIQNVGSVPISVNFLSDVSSDSYVYFSFGTGPNATPSSYLMDPLSILAIQTVFTSNNVIRFYNSFLDALNPNQLTRILDQAFKNGYYDNGKELVGQARTVSDVVTSADYTLKLKDNHYAQTRITTSGSVTITVDGTDLPGDATALFTITSKDTTNIALVNLVGTPNYLDQPFPSSITGTWFFAVTSTRVAAYDGSGSVTGTSTMVGSTITGPETLVITLQEGGKDTAVAIGGTSYMSYKGGQSVKFNVKGSYSFESHGTSSLSLVSYTSSFSPTAQKLVNNGNTTDIDASDTYSIGTIYPYGYTPTFPVTITITGPP